MAKNSNKEELLAKRKIELEHAIRNGFSGEVISRRVERLRLAVHALIKKDLGQLAFRETNLYHESWKQLMERWNNLTEEQVIEIVGTWPDSPRMKDLGWNRSF